MNSNSDLEALSLHMEKTSFNVTDATIAYADDDPYAFAPVRDALPSWSYPLICAYLLVVGVFGVASNLAIVAVFAKNSVVGIYSFWLQCIG